MALYLIEKGFRYNTVSDLAHEYQLNEVEKLLHQIRQNGCLEEDASESVNEVSRANGVRNKKCMGLILFLIRKMLILFAFFNKHKT